MNVMNLMMRSYLLLLALSIISACSSGPAIQEFPVTANPRAELQNLSNDLKVALENQVHVLSPENYEKAQEQYNKAYTYLDKQQSDQKTLHAIATGRAYLARAMNFSAMATSNIKLVMQARQLALVAGAQTYVGDDFEEAEEELRDITMAIEKNDVKKAEERKDQLQLTYMDLELRSIKLANLGPIRNTVDLAIKEGAEDYAPRSLAITEKSIQDADAFITADRHNSEEIRTQVMAADQEANHLLKITRESKLAKKKSPEELALEIENEQKQVAMKDAEIQEREALLQSQQSQVSSKERAIGFLMSKNKDLESENLLNERYEEVRKSFTKSEADVYKEGDAILIRLKGLEFPVAGSKLNETNYPLLEKVSKVINDLGKSSVTVEGHTDSTGSKALNQKLSAGRAEAVKDYFLQHADDKIKDIKAVGLDYQKPLASNKTPVGRAQNRRVDVIINPIQ